MFKTQQDLDAWLQQSIDLFPDVEQWMKIWREAKTTTLRHLSDHDYQVLMRYLEKYYHAHREREAALV